MNHTTCDLCGEKMLKASKIRYEVKAAYDPLNITEAELGQDFRKEFATVLQELERLSADEAQDQVYRLFEFDLCPACQRKYVKNPLPKEILAS